MSLIQNDAHNQLVECPYDKSHRMLRKRLQQHLLKCRVNHPEVELQTCPFNKLHLIPEPEFVHHVTNCSDRKLITQYKYDAPVSSHDDELDRVKQEPIECDENWDDTEVDDYDPKKYVATANVLRQPDMCQPAKRKAFFKKERKRLGDYNSDDEREEIKKIKHEWDKPETMDEKPIYMFKKRVMTPPPPPNMAWFEGKAVKAEIIEDTTSVKREKKEKRKHKKHRHKSHSSREQDNSPKREHKQKRLSDNNSPGSERRSRRSDNHSLNVREHSRRSDSYSSSIEPLAIRRKTRELNRSPRSCSPYNEPLEIRRERRVRNRSPTSSPYREPLDIRHERRELNRSPPTCSPYRESELIRHIDTDSLNRRREQNRYLNNYSPTRARMEIRHFENYSPYMERAPIIQDELDDVGYSLDEDPYYNGTGSYQYLQHNGGQIHYPLGYYYVRGAHRGHTLPTYPIHPRYERPFHEYK